MSAPPPSAAAAAPASVRGLPKKRPRHFWEGPDHADDGDEEKQGAAHVAPVARLYRHALESVFGFLTLKDLGRVLSVSRSWCSAVRSMPPLDASVCGPHRPYLMAASALASHVSHFTFIGRDRPRGVAAAFLPSDLFILSRPPFSLHSLKCDVKLSSAARLFIGASLRSLQLQIEGTSKAAPVINDAIVTISRLPLLELIDLELPEYFPELSFEPFTGRAPRLQVLNLGSRPSNRPTLQQLDQLRSLPHLRQMMMSWPHLDDFAYLLRAPHSLQWQETSETEGMDDATAATLSSLPSLTALTAWHCLSAAFLPSLPRLRALQLYMEDTAHVGATIIAGLSSCAELTDLMLEAADVTSQHLRQALSHLPLLRRLTVQDCSALDSLSFLSECAHLAQSLQSLTLRADSPVTHSTDLKHLLTLRNLTELWLHRFFIEPLDACARHLLTPPSLVLPKLERFRYHV